MSKTNKQNKKLNLLTLSAPEKSLEKHPSMKTFFNQVKEKEEEETNCKYNNDNININNDNFNIHIIEPKDIEEEKEEDKSKNENINIKINIIECEHKLYDGKDTFYLESKSNGKYNINKFILKNNVSKPLIYGFADNQKKLDEKITKQIYQRKKYNIIEKNFDGFLKNK